MSDKFIGNPPRIQLRDRDNRQGSIPGITRTGDTRTGVFNVSFDDTNTIIFRTGSNTVVYPHVLESGSNYILVMSGLTTTGSVVKGVSDKFNVFFSESDSRFSAFNEAMLPAQNTASFYLTGTNPTTLSGFSSPLKSKTRIQIDISANQKQVLSRYAAKRGDGNDASGHFVGQDLTGFCYYNFDLNRWEQIGLTDPESGSVRFYDYAVELTASDAANRELISGTQHFPMQFMAANGSRTSNATTRANQNYKLIGTPTITCFAPFGNQYHATSSQRIKMSDYINHPFLLEKVVVELPVAGQKNAGHFFNDYPFRVEQEDYIFFIYRQEHNEYPWPLPSLRNVATFPDQYVSASHRYLICSGAATFYNSLAPEDGSDTSTYSFEPLNTPTWSHDWGINPFLSASIMGTNVSGTFTGSIEYKITAAVASARIMGSSRVPQAGSVNTDQGRLTHYWPGGTSYFPFGPTGSHGKIPKGSAKQAGHPFVNVGGIYQDDNAFGLPTFKAFSDDINEGGEPSFKGAKKNLPIEKLDGRTRNPLGGNNAQSVDFGGTKSIDGEQSRPSPYLLLPEDELVFGIEAAKSIASGSTFNSLTGSFLEIQTGEAKITFYGSQVRAGKEFHEGLNQDLTSEAVKEYLHYDNPVVDEFLVGSREHYAGSYKAGVFVGTFSGSRNNNFTIQTADEFERLAAFDDAIMPRITRNANGSPSVSYDLHIANPDEPSLIGDYDIVSEFPRNQYRFSTFSTDSERFFDTLLPPINVYLWQSGARLTGSVLYYATNPNGTVTTVDIPRRTFKYHGALVTVSSSGLQVKEAKHFFCERDGNHMPPVFKTNPTRVLSDEETALIVSMSDGGSGGHYRERHITNITALRYLLFTQGFRSDFRNVVGSFTQTSGKSLHHKVTGSTGYKYGVQGILPKFSRTVFRTDRFGQFRDMLEQRQDGAFYDEIGVAPDGTVTGKKGKNSPVVKVRFINQERGSFKLDGGGIAAFSGSSNRSVAATSSLPYDDGQYSNWDNVF